MLTEAVSIRNAHRTGIRMAGKPRQFNKSAERKPANIQAEREEQRLIQSVLAGDRDAFAQLVQPYERMIYGTVLSIVGNQSDAEEITQEAVLKAFRALKGFRAESKFSTWIVQIAINESRMKLRKERPHLYESLEDSAKTEDGEYVPRDVADWREIPSEALERKQLRHALLTALNALPEKYREVLVMRDVNSVSIAETAQALGITEASVKTRLLRARLQMRDALAPGLGGAWSRKESSDESE